MLLERAYEMFSGFWQWLHDTSPGQATFIGSVFGFLALLGGAWANASFNRKREDRLRREEQRGVATALRAELAGCRRVKARRDVRTASGLEANMRTGRVG
jgi:hypothetical protein